MNIQEILSKGNYHLIDVREGIELEMDGSIESATNIPLGEVEERLSEIEALQGDVLVFCRSGNRSGKAVDYYQACGLDNVYNAGAYLDLINLI